jgi:hypothetical protein
MTKTREWPVRVMYILIAAALAISLMIMAAPAQKVSGDCTADVCAEWDKVSTPTIENAVLAPESTIIDYALAEDGDIAYVIFTSEAMNSTDWPGPYFLAKSIDAAATWSDITKGVKKEIDKKKLGGLTGLLRVATDWESADFLAVAVTLNTSSNAYVFISTDGGDTFVNAGEVKDGSVSLPASRVSDLVVSLEVDGERDIAIGGQDGSGNAALFRCTVDGDKPGDWMDATDYTGDYDGWDDDGDFTSILVTDLIFSRSWETDRTILAVTVDDLGGSPPSGYVYGTIYLQSGVWGETSAAWNEAADFAPAVPVKENTNIPYWLRSYDARAIAGITLPKNYAGDDDEMRYSWVWVNYYDSTTTTSLGKIFRVRDDAVDEVDTQISKTPWLTNVSYLGEISAGKAIAGLLADSAPYPLDEYDLLKKCCEGVQVYRNAGITNMEICCLEWDKSCKPPTGQIAMAVSYVSEDKAYAVALMGVTDYDEGAWSWSFDDGKTWNQLSLIDTWIDYLSDVAVSPDCNKTMLVSVNEDYWERDEYISDAEEFEEDHCVILYPLGDNYYDVRWVYCDSVWLYAETLSEAEEYSGYWIRTWCGILEGINDDEIPGSNFPERGLLRLAPEETTGDTVYLVDRMTDTVYYNDMETLACWDQGTATVDEIIDLAVEDESTIYALDQDGHVAMSDDHGSALTWSDSVDSEVTNGWTIAVWSNDTTYVLVGGQDGDVSYTADFEAEEDVFTELKDVATSGYVTVAFDSYFDANDTIYAALAGADDDNGIYLLVIGGTPEEWHKLAAEPYDYTGLVLDRPNPGNPKTSADTGGVLYASYLGYYDDWGDCCDDGYNEWYTGVARCLTPIVELCCGLGEAEWDYLTAGLSTTERFNMAPDALKICGCLTADSDSKLFAIDGSLDYDMAEGKEGTVWMFEDCYAKKGVELVSPDDEAVIGSDPCYGCESVPFPIQWNRLCDACGYEIELARDDEFTDIVDSWEICPDAPLTPSEWIDYLFTSESTYYWHIRAIEAETCQEIHSWWSETRSFTVAPSVSAAKIDLISPAPGDTDVAIKNVGFSWDLLATATEFDWVLDNNVDFSSPVEQQTALDTTAYGCTQTLSYNTTYYWQVTAYNEGVPISTSIIGTFRTMEQPSGPVTPVTPETPAWVWVVIAIGAVLVIVVIVLIFRTRRV